MAGMMPCTTDKTARRTAGVVHVTAVIDVAVWCQAEHWAASGPDEVVAVRCFRPGGAPVSAPFVVSFSQSSATYQARRAVTGTQPAFFGYSFDNQPANPAPTPRRPDRPVCGQAGQSASWAGRPARRTTPTPLPPAFLLGLALPSEFDLVAATKLLAEAIRAGGR